MRVFRPSVRAAFCSRGSKLIHACITHFYEYVKSPYIAVANIIKWRPIAETDSLRRRQKNKEEENVSI